ncbi:MAG: hypothetical protein AAGH40_14345, partial [Verrucomicrobiota bacterium]
AILSDGYPSDANSAFQAILENRRINKVDIRIYTVSYYSNDTGSDYLKKLAKDFDGSYIKR